MHLTASARVLSFSHHGTSGTDVAREILGFSGGVILKLVQTFSDTHFSTHLQVHAHEKGTTKTQRRAMHTHTDTHTVLGIVQQKMIVVD